MYAPAADTRAGQLRVNITHWTIHPGDVAPITGLERDAGRHAAKLGHGSYWTEVWPTGESMSTSTESLPID